MAQKDLGNTELVWTCPNCSHRSPGMIKTCQSCGSPQPSNVQFEQTEKQELITDPAKNLLAAKGPDIHCPFCGTRNSGDTKVCVQCGGDLKEGVKRETGRVVGAYQVNKIAATQIPCPSCGTLNPDTSNSCSKCGALLKTPKPAPKPISPPTESVTKPKKMKTCLAIAAGIVGAIILVIICVSVLIPMFTRSDLTGSVQSVSWHRSIVIEQIMDVTKKDWVDNIPSGAESRNCQKEYYNTSSNPEPVSTEVCGTPYTVDKGDGTGKVVQDCEYQVYKDRCEYTAREWKKVTEVPAEGSNLDPQWPIFNLSSDQREGDRKEEYVVLFDTGKKTYEHRTSDASLFSQCQINSEWVITINGFDQIVSIQPK